MGLPPEGNHEAADSVLIQRVHAGDQDAEGELFRRYFQKLLRMVYKPQLVRPAAIDSGIAAQSALRSVISHIRAARAEDLFRRDAFWGLLLRKLRDKVFEQGRRENRVKRGGGVILEQAALRATLEREPDNGGLEAVRSMEPTPEDLLRFEEFWSRLLACLPGKELRDIARLKINDGLTDREISLHIGKSLRTVELKLKLIRETWEPL